jgi:ABC-type multidrug transport system ATPase subunit
MQSYISCENVSKRYGYQKVLGKLNLKVENNQVLGLKGPNGSGKSTLLKIISGYLSPSLGMVKYVIKGAEVSRENIYKHISYAAPYIEGLPLLTIKELFEYYIKLKPLLINLDIDGFYDFINLPNQKNKLLRDFSSGMQQKVQIGLSIITDSKILLLDEPSSYLDNNAKKWMVNTLESYKTDRIVIVASNDFDDFVACDQVKELSELQR